MNRNPFASNSRPRRSPIASVRTGAVRALTALLLSVASYGSLQALQAVDCPTLAPTYPGAEWERVEDPGCLGWSESGLATVRDRLSSLSTTGFVAVVGGRVLTEYGDLERVSYLASVRKSILSMLYGI